MEKFIKLKYIILAVGVLASAAFYIKESRYDEPIVAFEEDADHGVSEPVLTDFNDIQKDTIDELVRAAVREELYAICQDGYLEKALSEVAVTAKAEADADAKRHEGMVNINTAAKEELMSLEGIGEKRAEDIISYRNSCGGFKSIDELMNVSGIKQASFDRIKDKIYV